MSTEARCGKIIALVVMLEVVSVDVMVLMSIMLLPYQAWSADKTSGLGVVLCAPITVGRRRQEAHTHVVAKFSATSSDGFWYHDSLGLALAGVL